MWLDGLIDRHKGGVDTGSLDLIVFYQNGSRRSLQGETGGGLGSKRQLYNDLYLKVRNPKDSFHSDITCHQVNPEEVNVYSLLD